MKKIVVALDFSSGSIRALKYAINIANKINSDICMIWVDITSKPESIYSSVVKSYRGEVIKRFKELVEKFQPELKGGKLEYKLRKGKIYYEIVTYARAKGAELIVTGSHGVSGFEEYWIGSNANRIVGHAYCPVITVRNGFRIKKNIRKIVVPIDNSKNTLIKIPFTARLAKIFNSEVHIVGLYSTTLKTIHKRIENYAVKAKMYLEKEGVKYVYQTVLAENSTKSAIDYSNKIQADLISIMIEQEEKKQTGLLGPSAQQIVNHSQIPVLSVHVTDNFNASKLFDSK